MNIANNEELVKSENTVNRERYIEVPRGWNRYLENGSIVYFSPTQICLRSKEDIARYLISDRTCKCGLDCPLYIDKVFNFDASLPSCHFKLTKLENDHKTLCKETIKARFATLAQTPTVVKQEVKVSKPVIIKKKSEVSVSKKKNETSKLPSFDTFVSFADAKPSQSLQGALTEEPKPKKPRRPASHKKKSNLTVTSVIPMSAPTAAKIPICQTAHSNTAPILHSAFQMQKSSSKDAMSKAQQYPTVSTGAVFGTSEQYIHPQNVGSLLTFPSTQLNASSFLAAMSSAPSTIPGRTTTSCAGEVSYVHPLHPFSTKSTVEHAPFGQKLATFPGAPNQPNNVVYLSSGLHTIPNQNSKLNWPQVSGIPLSMLPQGKGSADKPSLDKSKGGCTMKAKDSLPKMVYPYPTQAPSAKSTMSCSSASPVTSKVQMKQQDLPQVIQKQQTSVKTTVPGRSEPVLQTAGHPSTKTSSTDKHNNTRAATNPVDPLNQPLQYCGILLQPGMVPQVQLTGAGPRPSVSAGNSQEQNPYGNVYTLQGLPYGSNVANPAVVGMTPNTVIPYFVGIAQQGNMPKPIVPATTSTNTTKESSPTCSAAPVSTSAIAAAYSAFVSIAPASVTNSSFSQQLVNLVSNYNNPYWQHLLTQGANSNTLAYQLMQISQYASTRPGLPSQNTKTSTGKNTTSSHGQTKMTTSSSKSSGSSSQESKPKIATKNSVSVPITSSVVTTSSVVSTSCAVTSTTETTVTEGDRRKTTDSTTITSESCTSSTVTACTNSATVVSTNDNIKDERAFTSSERGALINDKGSCTTSVAIASTNDISAEKNARTGSETSTSTNEILTEKCVSTSSEIDASTRDNSAEKMDCTSSGTVASANDDSAEKSDCTSSEKDALRNDNSEEKSACANSEIVALIDDDSAEKMECTSNETVALTKDNSAEKSDCTGSEMDASRKDKSAETTSDKPCENSPGDTNLTDTITQNSSEEMCTEITNNEDKTAPPHEVSKDTLTEEITDVCFNSTTEKVGVTSVTVNRDSVNVQENEQKIDFCTLGDENIVTSECKSTSECEKIKLENANTECTTVTSGSDNVNVTSDSENVNNECNNATSDSGNVSNEVNECTNLIAVSKCEEDILVNNDSANTNKEKDIEVLEEEKDISCDVKTDSRGDNDIEADSLEDKEVKTDLIADTNVKTDPLGDNMQGEILMETKDDTSSSMSNKQNCDEDSKVKDKQPVDSDVQNGKTESMSNDTKSTKEVINKEMETSEAPVEFTIGDIVWAQARGLPSWPGKIVHERDVGKAAADIGKKWVMWFGDHNFSQVEVEKLKTLTDGLKTLDDKGRKRKYRGKRTRIGLEQAISEALEELDQRERLRSRQGPKAKKRRL